MARNATLLITGASGFVGPHVVAAARALLPNARIVAASRSGAHAAADEAVALDLSVAADVDAVVGAVRPDAVIHLAGASRDTDFSGMLRINVAATDVVLDALRRFAPRCRMVIAGSSAELGLSDTPGVPLDESAPCRPIGAYGITKLYQSVLGRAAFDTYGQHVVRVRLFNLSGPGMPDTLLAGRCASLLAARLTETGGPPLRFGNLSTRRDYVDVRDAARALVMAIDRGEAGALYHIGSGRSWAGHEVVSTLMDAAGLQVPVESAPDSALDLPDQVADARRARGQLGWVPQRSFEDSLRDLWQTALRSAQPAVRSD